MNKIYNFVPKNKYALLIILVIFFSFIARVIFIGNYPPSLNWDEVSHGYNAYSILTHGTDEWGNRFPTIFRAYGDYKLPVYIYTTVLSVFTFGLNSFAVRFPSVLAGTATVAGSYFIANQLFNSKKHSLFIAFLVGISSWNIFVSRAALEANLSVFYIVFGLYFLLKSRDLIGYLPFGVLFLGLSVWTYNSARVFVPFMLIATLIIYRKEFKKAFRRNISITLVSTVLLGLFMIPMIMQLSNPEGQARYTNVAIIDAGAVSYIEEKRNNSELPQFITKLLHNRPAYFLTEVTKNYVSHFMPDFLFIRGGDHYQFSVPNHGLFYTIYLPFFYIGLGLLALKSKEQKYAQFILAWILLAPIASSITREAPHALRSIVMNPAPFLIITFGFFWILERLKIRFLLPLYIILIFLSFALWVFAYRVYSIEYSWAWQYGHSETIEIIKDKYDSYDQVIMTKKYGEPHEFILFFWPWDSLAYNSDENLVRFYQSNWYWVDRFDKFYFVNDWEIPTSQNIWKLESGLEFSPESRSLLVTSPGKYPDNWNLLTTIYFLDGTPAFDILEYEKN